MIGVIIPAHNEAGLIAACLASVRCAATHPSLRGEAVRPLVVLDACTDASAEIVSDFGFEALCIEARNVGVARAAGAEALLSCGARWLA
ncbi:glycosyltransferase, partial [Paraburkholderia sp. BR14262]